VRFHAVAFAVEDLDQQLARYLIVFTD